MEIVKRYKNSTVWAGKDAEGRTVYTRTNNVHGRPYQPYCCAWPTIKQAEADYRMDQLRSSIR